MTDPIAELLTRIRNANKMHHEKVSIPSSTLKLNILKVLKEEGFIADYVVIEDKKQNVIEVTLKYNNNQAVIKGLRRISKPGLRKYTDVENLPKVLHGLGIAIISTSKGVMTDSEARKQKVGGEVLAYIW